MLQRRCRADHRAGALPRRAVAQDGVRGAGVGRHGGGAAGDSSILGQLQGLGGAAAAAGGGAPVAGAPGASGLLATSADLAASFTVSGYCLEAHQSVAAARSLVSLDYSYLAPFVRRRAPRRLLGAPPLPRADAGRESLCPCPALGPCWSTAPSLTSIPFVVPYVCFRLLQVKEPVLVKDVLYACQGVQGKFTAYQDSDTAPPGHPAQQRCAGPHSARVTHTPDLSAAACLAA